MARKNPLSNFELPLPVKRHLIVTAKVIEKDMTALLVILIEKAYRDVLNCFPDKVKSIELELEQKANVALR